MQRRLPFNSPSRSPVKVQAPFQDHSSASAPPHAALDLLHHRHIGLVDALSAHDVLGDGPRQHWHLGIAQDVVNEIPALSQPEPVAASADVLGPDSLEISLAVHPQRRVDMYQVGLMSRDLPLQFRIIAGRCH